MEELEWNAYHDRLTALYNRNRYMTDSEALFSHETGYGVASFDINGLKWTNDTSGHEAGDQLIRCAGDDLKTMEKEGKAYCYRVGGTNCPVLRDTTEEELRRPVIRYAAEPPVMASTASYALAGRT